MIYFLLELPAEIQWSIILVNTAEHQSDIEN